jgi:hypothetical protein
MTITEFYKLKDYFYKKHDRKPSQCFISAGFFKETASFTACPASKAICSMKTK